MNRISRTCIPAPFSLSSRHVPSCLLGTVAGSPGRSVLSVLTAVGVGGLLIRVGVEKPLPAAGPRLSQEYVFFLPKMPPDIIVWVAIRAVSTDC